MMLPHEWVRDPWAVCPRDPATMLATAGAAFTGATGLTGVQAGSLALTGVGAGISALGTIAGGNMAKTAADMKAKAVRDEASLTAQQLQQNASTTRAVSQRQALDTTQRTEQAQSELTAKSAGSGLAASGSTNVALHEQIEGRGEYMALGEMASGENQARGMENQASFTKYGAELEAEGAQYSGAASQLSSYYAAAGTIASGGGSMLKNYGGFTNPPRTV